ncbi:MAG TPA: MFS transporter [Gemmatimonadales bacterium]|nr:MFS transporter [Gemmatimonadales bacterium]
MIGLDRPPCDQALLRAAAPGTRGCAERARPWVLASAILGSSMAFIDGSVVNVALPAMQADLATSVAGAQWIVNAYQLMLGALILVGGAAGDRFGRRRIFVLGIALFAAASIGCGLAPDVAVLIAARAVQGVGGALLVPSSLALISAAFPQGERGRAIGTWAGFSALTTALGPVLGGWLVDGWSWRPIFFVNVPLALVTLRLALRHVPESRGDAADAPVDWRGGVLAAAGLGALVYGLTAASRLGWTHPGVLGSLLAGALVVGLFLRHEAGAALPMVPLHLFRSAAFSGANAMTFLLYFALGGALFFLPFNLIRIQGYSATLAGAAFLPFTVIMAALSRWSGGLIDRYGARAPLTIGPVVVAAGFALLAVPGLGGSYWTTFFPGMAVLGFGMAVSVAPLTTTVMGAVEDRHAGAASGINNAVARLAGMLAVALLGAVAVGAFGAALDRHLAGMRVSPEVRRAVLAEAPRLAEARLPAVGAAERAELIRALHQSFVWSFRIIMLVAAALALLSGLCAWLTIGPARSRRAHGATPSSG